MINVYRASLRPSDRHPTGGQPKYEERQEINEGGKIDHQRKVIYPTAVSKDFSVTYPSGHALRERCQSQKRHSHSASVPGLSAKT